MIVDSFVFLSFFSVHPPPTFGSFPNHEVFSLQANRYPVEDDDAAADMAPPCVR